MSYCNFYNSSITASNRFTNGVFQFENTSNSFNTWWSSNKFAGIAEGSYFFKIANAVALTGVTVFGYQVYKFDATSAYNAFPSSTKRFHVFLCGDVAYKTPTEIDNVNTYGIKNGSNTAEKPEFARTFRENGTLYVYAIRIQYTSDYYWYPIAMELSKSSNVVTGTSTVNAVPSSFKPYQPVSFTTAPSITVSLTPYTYSSLEKTAGTATSETKTFSFSSYYTAPGEQEVYVTINGKRYYYSITITDWDSKTYEIVATGSTYDIYTGKEVGTDFLQAFKVQLTKTATWTGGSKTDISYPKTALELSKMSKTIISESDADFTFSYDISDITETSTTSLTKTISSFHKLASGTVKFNNLTRKTSFSAGDTIGDDSSMIGGSLTYDDNTTISLSDVTISGFSVSSSVGTLPHEVTIDTPALFTITYVMSLDYFGELTFTDNCSTDESVQVGRVEFVDYKETFTPNEVIAFGSNAKLKVYNGNNELVKTITSADLNNYVSNLDSKYGQYANNYKADGAIRLTFMAYNMQLEQIIYINYNEATLVLNTNSVTLSYIFDPEDDEFEFDYTGLVIKRVLHTNTSSGTTTTETTISLNDSNLSITQNPSVMDAQNARDYAINVVYTDSYGQQLTGTFTIHATPLQPTRLVFSGSPSSVQYYDNGVEKFKLPQGITITLVYNDPTYNEVLTNDQNFDWSRFEFYRDASHETLLADGVSVIARANGNSIYVHSLDYNVDGHYDIDWLTDTVQSISLASPINVFLGNKLNKASVKSQVSFNVLWASGNTTIINNANEYAFSITSIIFEAPTKSACTVILTNRGTFEISNFSTYITWNKPYAVMSFDLTNFQQDYNNNVDVIYPDGIKAIVSYYEDANHTTKCDYEQECTYSSTATNLYNKFTVAGLNDLQNYTFGSQVLNITMTGVSQVNEGIRVSANNRFYSSGDNAIVTNDITVRVIEILTITGIKLLNAKTTYNVGETFLNENDNTQIMIFYTDANNVARTYTCYLRTALTALNIYPLKGTRFEQIVQNKVVTITSATNYNVSVQYAIDVKANYVYDDTAKHNLVAIFLDDYECPDGVERSKFFLVERQMTVNGEVIETTKLDPVNGDRILNDGVDVSDLEVFGYLEDIGDTSINARVILFKDYISPIEGSNNITVKFPCYVEGNADLINKCHFGIMFGNNNSKNRLFLSGNADYKNKDWHSGQVDSTHTSDEALLTGNYGYFEDLSECIYGETDNAVVGYDIVSNDKLLVLKDHSDKETTVYFRQPQLVTAINGSGTAVTGLDDETLYQEEFSLSKGNNTVAGVNPKSILNFNGDCMFLSHDKQVLGLDLTGIIGDNQRYANSRSYFIDEELKHQDLTEAFMWSNNKYLFLVLKNKIYVTHFETKHDNQYEWFIIDVPNVTSVLEKDDVIYFGCKNGEIFKVSDLFKDATKVFAGYGVTRLSVNDETELITASEYLSELDTSVDPVTQKPRHTYYFKPVPFTDMGADDDPYIYYSLGSIRNERTSNCDFYVDNSNNNNVLELLCMRNGAIDFDRMNLLLKRIIETEPVYFNKIDGTESEIACASGSVFETAYKKPYFLKEYAGDSDKHLYQVIDENGDVMPVKELYRARLCMKIIHETEMADIDVENGTFSLKSDGEVLDIVQYSNQSLVTAFRGEIIEYSNVEAYYITNPITMGSLEYLKTIWSFTLTNDTNLPSELDLCYATNKIPYEEMKTLASISKDTLGFDFESFNFARVDFDKNVVPRTYTHKRVLSGVKFVCFGFKNYEDSNSVLSSMSVTYTVPYPSYSGD